MKATHKYRWTKVNAPIDTNISCLVEALSLFPELQTVESCEGNGSGSAWISFRYGDYIKHPWRDIAYFVLGYFGPGIARKVGDRVNVSIRVSENGDIYCELFVARDAISIVTKAIRQLHREWIIPAHKCGCFCGK